MPGAAFSNGESFSDAQAMANMMLPKDPRHLCLDAPPLLTTQRLPTVSDIWSHGLDAESSLTCPHPKHQSSMTPNKLIITVILSTSIGSLQNKKINLTKSYVSLLIRATRQQRVHSSIGNCNIPKPLSFTAGLWISMVLFSHFLAHMCLTREYIIFSSLLGILSSIW